MERAQEKMKTIIFYLFIGSLLGFMTGYYTGKSVEQDRYKERFLSKFDVDQITFTVVNSSIAWLEANK